MVKLRQNRWLTISTGPTLIVNALKLTADSIPSDDIFALIRNYDSIGGMTKCVPDLVALTELLMPTHPRNDGVN